MGAKELQPVQIMCVLTQKQIEDVVNYVSKSLPNNLKDDLSDIDELMYNDSIRVCVDFGIGIFGDLEIEAAEILNSDWDVLENDSFAFSQRLKTVIEDYNLQHKGAYNQAIEIQSDQRSYIPC